MNDVRIPCSGRGRPCAERSGIESLRCVFEIGSTQCGGTCLIAMPISCAGMPAVARRTICGGVRTDSRERFAPPSATSCAISAPEFPAPTTSTSRPRNGCGVAILRRVDQLAGELRRGPASRERTARRCSPSRRSRRRRAAARARSRGASRRRRGRSASRACRCGRRARARRRSARRYSIRSSRATQRPKRRGIRSPGRPERRRGVCRRSRS